MKNLLKKVQVFLYRISVSLRMWLISLLMWFGVMQKYAIAERMNFLHIGFSGHVSEVDKAIAKQKNLEPLTGFWLWLMKPMIEVVKEVNQRSWRLAVLRGTGEDIGGPGGFIDIDDEIR